MLGFLTAPRGYEFCQCAFPVAVVSDVVFGATSSNYGCMVWLSSVTSRSCSGSICCAAVPSWGVVTTVLVGAASRNRCLAEESVIGGLSLLVALMSDKQLVVAIVDYQLWTMATGVLASLIDS